MPDVASQGQRIKVAQRAVRSIPGAKLDPAAITKTGSLANILTSIGIALCEDVESRVLAKLVALTFQAAGDELDAAVAEATFGIVTRFGASPSRVPLALARPISGYMPSGTLVAGTKIACGSLLFTLDAPVSFATSQAGPIGVNATCTAAGSQTNTGLTSVFAIDGSNPSFDPAITVTPTDVGAGGGDKELDPALIARAMQFPQAVKGATAAAVQFGALLVPGVRQAVTVEQTSLYGAQAGRPILYIGDANGQANSALVAAVKAQLLEYRVLGFAPFVVGSTPIFQAITIGNGFGVQSGYDTGAVQSMASAAIVAAVNGLAPNAPLLLPIIKTALQAVPGTIVPDTCVVTPALDVYPPAGASLRTRPDLVSFVS